MNEQNVPKRKSAWLKCGVIAGCVVLLLALGFGVYMFAKPKENAPIASTPSTGATETTSATEPTADTQPPVDDGSHNIKITSLTLAGTTKNPTQTVRITPVEISLPVQTDELVSIPKTTYPYRSHTEYINDSTDDEEVVESYIEKYDGDTLLWCATVTEFSMLHRKEVSDGLLVYGYGGKGYRNQDTWIAKISNDGEILWKCKLNKNFEQTEYVREVLENADGTYSIFTGCTPYFNLHKLSADGQYILFQENDVASTDLRYITQVGNGYWMRLFDEESELVRMDSQGNITEYLHYSCDRYNYNFYHIIEYNGKVYLSGNVTPKLFEPDPESLNSLETLDRNVLLEDIQKDESLWTENFEDAVDVTERYKNHYSAVLIVCDANIGTPEAIYTVKESKGGALAVNDAGQLVWDVKEIRNVRYAALCCAGPERFEYQWNHFTFDRTGTLVKTQKTDKIGQG